MLKIQQDVWKRSLSKSWFNLDYFSVLQEDMAPGHSPMYFHALFLIRRAIVVAIAFTHIDKPYFQLIFFMILTLYNAAYIAAANPFYFHVVDNLQLFNECVILIIAHLYVVLLVDNWEINGLTNMGHLLNGCVCVLFLGNFGFMNYMMIPA